MILETLELELNEPLSLNLGHRIRRALSPPAAFQQFIRFCLVGTSGYLVNLATYSLATAASLHYRPSAVLAFSLALFSNFHFNSNWTFKASGSKRTHLAIRFITVSLLAFAFSFTLLNLLVEVGDFPALLAQASSIVLATPLSFWGNKFWTFRL